MFFSFDFLMFKKFLNSDFQYYFELCDLLDVHKRKINLEFNPITFKV